MQTPSDLKKQHSKLSSGEATDWFACTDLPKDKPESRLQLGSIDKCPKCLKSKPEPEYPPDAKKKKITGQVKAEVLYGLLDGEVAWARLSGGDYY